MEKEVKYTSPKEVLEQDKEFMVKIGNRLYELRTQKNLTLTSLSDATDISRKSLSLYESGSLYPNFGILLKLITYYNVTPFDFFSSLNNDALNNEEI